VKRLIPLLTAVFVLAVALAVVALRTLPIAGTVAQDTPPRPTAAPQAVVAPGRDSIPTSLGAITPENLAKMKAESREAAPRPGETQEQASKRAGYQTMCDLTRGKPVKVGKREIQLAADECQTGVIAGGIPAFEKGGQPAAVNPNTGKIEVAIPIKQANPPKPEDFK
jgi:hypothetical protein